MNRLKFAAAFLLLGSVHCSGQSALFTAVGAVADFATVVGLIGDTQVFPSCAVHYWRHDYYGVYRNTPFSLHSDVNRDPINGQFFYYQVSRNPDGTYTKSTSPFPIQAVRRRSWYCDQSTTGSDGNVVKFIYNELEDFTMIVFHGSSPVQTGLYPPGPPYPIRVQTLGTRLARDCAPPPPVSIGIFVDVNLKSYGYELAKYGWMDFDYAWPPSLFKSEK